jgi:hypothetical protein
VTEDCGAHALLLEALERLRSALQLLDAAPAPAHIGAHVDLAIHELYLAAARRSAGAAFTQIETNGDLH